MIGHPERKLIYLGQFRAIAGLLALLVPYARGGRLRLLPEGPGESTLVPR